MDWTVASAAGAFVVGVVVGAVLAVRLTRVVWESAVRARRNDEESERAP